MLCFFYLFCAMSALRPWLGLKELGPEIDFTHLRVQFPAGSVAWFGEQMRICSFLGLQDIHPPEGNVEEKCKPA